MRVFVLATPSSEQPKPPRPSFSFHHDKKPPENSSKTLPGYITEPSIVLSSSSTLVNPFGRRNCTDPVSSSRADAVPRLRGVNQFTNANRNPASSIACRKAISNDTPSITSSGTSHITKTPEPLLVFCNSAGASFIDQGKAICTSTFYRSPFDTGGF